MNARSITARYRGRCASKRCRARGIRPGDRIVALGRGMTFHVRCAPETVNVVTPAAAVPAEDHDLWDDRADLR